MSTSYTSWTRSLRLVPTLALAAAIVACGDDDDGPAAGSGGGNPSLTVIRSGVLANDGAGGAPNASGTVELGMDAGGGMFIRLGADFAQEMGPGDTQLILASSADNVDAQRMRGDAVSPSLGTIPNGFSGAETYEIPSGTNPADFSHIIVWCPTAGVNFGAAELMDAGGSSPMIVRSAGLVADGAGGAPDATGTVNVVRNRGLLSVQLGADFMQEMGPGDTQLLLARTGDNIDTQRGADAASVSAPLGIIPNGASGERSFELPAGTDIDDFDYVVVWCPTAGVNFGAAELPKRSGTLVADGAGGAPDATGSVTLMRDASGQLLIELGADFMQEMGPGDTQLILARTSENVDTQRGADPASASMSLGIIPNGASGMQSFAIPDGVDLDLFDFAIVWCPTAGVNFGAASLD